MTINEVAEHFKVNPHTVYRLIYAGKLKATKDPISTEWSINLKDITYDFKKVRGRKKKVPTPVKTVVEAKKGKYAIVHTIVEGDTYMDALKFADEFFLLEGDVSPERLAKEGLRIDYIGIDR